MRRRYRPHHRSRVTGSSTSVRVLVVDSDRRVRQSLAGLIRVSDGLELAGVAADPAATVAAARARCHGRAAHRPAPARGRDGSRPARRAAPPMAGRRHRRDERPRRRRAARPSAAVPWRSCPSPTSRRSWWRRSVTVAEPPAMRHPCRTPGASNPARSTDRPNPEPDEGSRDRRDDLRRHTRAGRPDPRAPRGRPPGRPARSADLPRPPGRTSRSSARPATARPVSPRRRRSRRTWS